MNLKKINKKHLAIVVIVIAVASLIVWSIVPKTRQLVITPEIEKCAEEKLAVYHGTYAGHINVRFKSNVTTDQAIILINSYGLNYKGYHYQRTSFSYSFTVIIPNGNEFEWMCEFEKNPIVKDALNVLWGGGAG